MTREEHLKFCKKCLNREMDMQQGIICKITGKKADFEETCENFDLDETVKEEVVVEDNRPTTEIISSLDDSEKEKLIPHQDLFYAIIGGFFVSIICAFIWALITVTTEYQIGWMAIGVGLVVGLAVRFFGAGIEITYGIVGAFFALFGCMLGNLFSQVGFIADYQQMSYLNALKLVLNFETIVLIFEDSFSFMDLVFYAIAIGEGYKFAFRKVPEDIQQLADAPPAYAKLRRPLVIGFFVLISASFFFLSKGVSGTQTSYYENGNIESQGEMTEGVEQGEWSYYYENGSTYLVGNFTDGMESGLWTWYYESGQVMKKGNYTNGLYDGYVVTYTPEGAVTDSSYYQNGRLEGIYKLFHENGNIHQIGNYVRDKQDGEWKLYFEDGTLNGYINFDNGDISGITKAMYANGTPKHEFDYIDDEKILIQNAWLENGTQTVIDGNGSYTSYYDNGNKFEEGQVSNGEKVGNWTTYYTSGQKRETGEFNDHKYAMQSAWTSDGELMVENGNGNYVTYYEDSAFELETGEVKNGLRNGTWLLYYPNSIIIQMESNLKDGVMHGKQIAYYQSGGVYSEGLMENDEKTGEWTWYYETGGVHTQVLYQNGEKSGEQIFYSELGKEAKREVYENGKLISEEIL